MATATAVTKDLPKVLIRYTIFHTEGSHAEELKQCISEQQSMSLFVQPLKKYDANHPKQKWGTEALVDFITEDLMPLHLVESQRFQKLLSLLDPQNNLPSKKHLSKTLLRNKYDRLKAVVIEHLMTVTTLSPTTDLSSNHQMRSYLGITVHYITGNWKL